MRIRMLAFWPWRLFCCYRYTRMPSRKSYWDTAALARVKRFIILRTTIWPLITIGRSTILLTPMIATSGRFSTGVLTIPPRAPRLVRVMVEPDSIVLEQLRAIRGEIGKLVGEMQTMRVELTAVAVRLVGAAGGASGVEAFAVLDGADSATELYALTRNE